MMTWLLLVHTAIYSRQPNDLALKYQFTADNHTELECINIALTNILVSTYHKYAKHHHSPWSIKLHQAFLTHCYWMTMLTQAHTK